jgi:thiol-disulfide isomerase/thioredoxin
MPTANWIRKAIVVRTLEARDPARRARADSGTAPDTPYETLVEMFGFWQPRRAWPVLAALLMGTLIIAGSARAAPKIAMPSFVGISRWFNTKHPPTPESLRGKVVLVDFWTYSCVNCLRTLPYLEAWYARYHAFGLEIEGVHSPEFEFEADPSNVRAAVARLGITYPVGMDNEHRTWNAYYNRFWPAEYLVGRDGLVRSQHFGEGHYRATEKQIRSLLKEGRPELHLPPATTLNLPPPVSMTPEIYLGLDRLSNLGNASPKRPGELVPSSVPAKVEVDRFYLGGRWRFEREYAAPAAPDAVLVLRFRAREANMVLAAQHGSTAVIEVLIDGHPATPQNMGADVRLENQRAVCHVQGARLYTLAQFHGALAAHTLELRFSSANVRAYTFTFG